MQFPMSSTAHSQGIVNSAFWLPIDFYLEDAMDGELDSATSAAETLTGTLFITAFKLQT